MTEKTFASYELPPAIIRWVTMLRTTQLKQGQGLFYNHHDDTYCALGILCLANSQPFVVENGSTNYRYVDELLGPHGTIATYRNNDELYMSFPALADWAETFFSTHGPHVDRARLNALDPTPSQPTETTMQTIIPNYVAGGMPVEEDPKTPPVGEPVPTPPAEAEEIYDDEDDVDLDNEESDD